MSSIATKHSVALDPHGQRTSSQTKITSYLSTKHIPRMSAVLSAVRCLPVQVQSYIQLAHDREIRLRYLVSAVWG